MLPALFLSFPRFFWENWFSW